jgi:hypothetical protein
MIEENSMKLFLPITVLFLSLQLIAALPQNSVYEQLTGNKQQSKKVNAQSNRPIAKKPQSKVVASAQKALTLARESRSQKNYILAIKRFNFILKYYSKTSEAKTALAEKASLYKEMGLNEQATYNLNKLTQLASVKKAAASKNTQRLIK